jgi:hypothetical protein
MRPFVVPKTDVTTFLAAGVTLYLFDYRSEIKGVSTSWMLFDSACREINSRFFPWDNFLQKNAVLDRRDVTVPEDRVPYDKLHHHHL